MAGFEVTLYGRFWVTPKEVNDAVQSELASFDLAADFYSKFQSYYAESVRSKDLIGLTTDAAVAKIQSVLSSAIASAKAKTYLKDPVSTLSSQAIENAKTEVAAFLASAVDEALSELQTQSTKAKTRVTSDGQIRAATNAITAEAEKLQLSKPYLADVLLRFRSYAENDLEHRFSFQASSIVNEASQAAKRAFGYPYEQLPEESKTTVQTNLATELRAAISDATKQAATPIPAKPFQPPSDVSCSTAVLSWKEARDIFGGRVANTFVAIQVTLRNLNTKNEFLIHDIQVAVDTGLTPDKFGRFQAGRDKLLVRAVAQRGQSADPRNVTANVLQAIGSIAGASSITAGTIEFKDAVAVFQSAFLPGFSTIFPDHTVEEINHINDLVFSASSTSKVVVPVQGSVPLVTFISEKPIEELPFAWCGHAKSGWFRNKDENCEFNGGSRDPGYPDSAPDPSRAWGSLRYRDWSAAALRMLQMRTFVVIGGVHIQQIVTQPKLTNLNCKTLPSGPLDLSQTQDGAVSCKALGNGLDLVSNITLNKGSVSIAGKSQPEKDGNSALFEFNPADLCDKQGVYSLNVSYKADSQKDLTTLDSGESISLGRQSIVNSVSFSDEKLNLNGVCLDQLNSVSLAPQVGTAVVNGSSPIADQASKNTVASSQFTLQTAKDQGGLVPGATYYLKYTSKIQPTFVVEKEALTVLVPPLKAAPAKKATH